MRALVLAVAVLAACASTSTSGSIAASGNVVVTLDVLSATEITPGLCATGLAGRTDFGTILPDSKVVMSSDCSVGFGSSNDTSSLRIAQTDQFGSAMYRIPDGSPDTDFGPGGVRNFADAGSEDWRDAGAEPGGSAIVAGADFGVTGAIVERIDTTGTTDLAYGGDGIAEVADVRPFRVEIDPDGSAWIAGHDVPGSDEIALVHLDTEGDPDPALGGGTGTAKLSPQAGANHVGRGLAIAPDGSVVVAGWIEDGGGNEEGVLAWFERDGTPRTSFAGGTIRWDPTAGSDLFYDVVFDSAGRLVVAGVTEPGTDEDGVVVRFLPDGTIDNSFATLGVRAIDGPDAADHEYLGSIDVDAAGRIVASGASFTTRGRVFAVRLDSLGDLDSSWGAAGIAQYDVAPAGTGAWGNEQEFDAAGNLVIMGDGYSAGSKTYFAARLTPAGDLDQAFGDNGYADASVAAGADDGNGGALLADGRIMTVGNTGSGDRGAAVFGSLAVADLQDAVDDWNQGAATGMFGACLRAVTLAAPTWTADGTCDAADGAEWRSIGPAPSTIATAASGETGAVADLQFGVRTATDQPPGTYVAPVTFEVVAP